MHVFLPHRFLLWEVSYKLYFVHFSMKNCYFKYLDKVEDTVVLTPIFFPFIWPQLEIITLFWEKHLVHFPKFFIDFTENFIRFESVLYASLKFSYCIQKLTVNAIWMIQLFSLTYNFSKLAEYFFSLTKYDSSRLESADKVLFIFEKNFKH